MQSTVRTVFQRINNLKRKLQLHCICCKNEDLAFCQERIIDKIMSLQPHTEANSFKKLGSDLYRIAMVIGPPKGNFRLSVGNSDGISYVANTSHEASVQTDIGEFDSRLNSQYNSSENVKTGTDSKIDFSQTSLKSKPVHTIEGQGINLEQENLKVQSINSPPIENSVLQSVVQPSIETSFQNVEKSKSNTDKSLLKYFGDRILNNSELSPPSQGLFGQTSTSDQDKIISSGMSNTDKLSNNKQTCDTVRTITPFSEVSYSDLDNVTDCTVELLDPPPDSCLGTLTTVNSTFENAVVHTPQILCNKIDSFKPNGILKESVQNLNIHDSKPFAAMLKPDNISEILDYNSEEEYLDSDTMFFSGFETICPDNSGLINVINSYRDMEFETVDQAETFSETQCKTDFNDSIEDDRPQDKLFMLDSEFETVFESQEHNVIGEHESNLEIDLDNCNTTLLNLKEQYAKLNQDLERLVAEGHIFECMYTNPILTRYFNSIGLSFQKFQNLKKRSKKRVTFEQDLYTDGYLEKILSNIHGIQPKIKEHCLAIQLHNLTHLRDLDSNFPIIAYSAKECYDYYTNFAHVKSGLKLLSVQSDISEESQKSVRKETLDSACGLSSNYQQVAYDPNASLINQKVLFNADKCQEPDISTDIDMRKSDSKCQVIAGKVEKLPLLGLLVAKARLDTVISDLDSSLPEIPHKSSDRYLDSKLLKHMTCTTYLYSSKNVKNYYIHEIPYGQIKLGIKNQFQGYLQTKIDGIYNQLPARVLVDTGATLSIINLHFIDKYHIYESLLLYDIKPTELFTANDSKIMVNHMAKIVLQVDGHMIEMVCYVAPISTDYDIVLGYYSNIEIMSVLSWVHGTLNFAMCTEVLYLDHPVTVKPNSKVKIELNVKNNTLFDNWLVGKLHASRADHVPYTFLVYINSKGKIYFYIQNQTNFTKRYYTSVPILSLDLRTLGDFETISNHLHPHMKETCNLLDSSIFIDSSLEQEPVNKSGLYRIDNDTQKQTTVSTVDNDDLASKYPWLEPESPLLKMTDEQIIDKCVNLSEALISDAEKMEVVKLLKRYKETIALRGEIGLVPQYLVRLQLKPNTPIWQIQPYSVSDELKPSIDHVMRNMELKGIVKKGMSPYCSPAFFISKGAQRNPRLLIDYRHLNANLLSLSCTLPLLKEMLQRISFAINRDRLDAQGHPSKDKPVLTSVDLSEAYFSLQLDGESQDITYFNICKGISGFNMLRLPQGISVAPSLFSFFVNEILLELPERYKYSIISILDDILYVSSQEHYFKFLEELLKILKKYGLKMNVSKLQVAREKIKFFGVVMKILGNDIVIEIQESRVNAILKLKPPTTPKLIRQFCGMMLFVSPWIEGLHELLAPFYKQSRKKNKVEWTPELDENFNKLKHKLTTAPVLYLPKPQGTYYLVTDCSTLFCGAVLLQEDIVTKEKRLIGYNSKKLGPSVVNYSSSELEAYGLVLNLKCFSHLLLGQSFVVITDHDALIHILKSTKQPKTKRLKRFLEYFSDYQFRIYYRKPDKTCPELLFADYLSRNVSEEEEEQLIKECIPITFNMHECMAITRSQSQLTPEVKDLEQIGSDNVVYGSIGSSQRLDSYDYDVYPIPDPKTYNYQPITLNIDNRISKCKSIPYQRDLDKVLELLQRKYIASYRLSLNLCDLSASLFTDPYFSDITKWLVKDYCILTGKARESFLLLCERYVMCDNLLFYMLQRPSRKYRILLCITQKYIHQILYFFHDLLFSAHQGVIKMFNQIRRYYKIPKLFQNIRKYIASCTQCVPREPKGKNQMQSYEYARLLDADYHPMSWVSADIKTMPPSDDGYRYLLIFTCSKTHFMVTACLKECTTEAVCQALTTKIVSVWGPPVTVISDLASCFTSKDMLNYFDKLNIKSINVSVANHQSLLVESSIKTYSNILAKYLTDYGGDWPIYTSMLCYSYNASYHHVLKASPYYFMFLKHPRNIHALAYDILVKKKIPPEKYLDVMKSRSIKISNMLTELRIQQQVLGLTRSNRNNPDVIYFSKMDLCWLECADKSDLKIPSKKLNKKVYTGPYVILTSISRTLHLLAPLLTRVSYLPLIVHKNRLKPYYLKFGEMEEGVIVTLSNVNDLMSKLTQTNLTADEAELCQKWLEIINPKLLNDNKMLDLDVIQQSEVDINDTDKHDT